MLILEIILGVGFVGRTGNVAAEYRNSKSGDVYKANISRTLLPPKYPVSISFNFHIIR